MFEHCNYQNLIDVYSLVVHLSIWLLEVLICSSVTTNTRTIYTLHDRDEDEESKSLIH